jgi:membrane protein YdbS with pleckstrin-like domain
MNQTISISLIRTSPIFFLFISLAVLKLAHVIAWPWWVITAPLWIPSGAILIFVLILLLWLMALNGIGKISSGIKKISRRHCGKEKKEIFKSKI